MPSLQFFVTQAKISLLALLTIMSTLVPFWESLASPTLPGQKCSVKPLPKWTMTEKWIWEQNCIGLTANLNRYFGEEADPLYPDHWIENRRITQGFMETILLHQPWHGALHRQGVRIIGAWFHEGLTLDGATLSRQLWLTHSRFEENVWLNQIKAKRKISFNGSFFAKDLSLDDSEIHGTLQTNDCHFADFYIRNAKVHGDFRSRRTSVGRHMQLYGTNIAGNFFPPDNVDTFWMYFTRIGGSLDLSTTRSRKIFLEGAQIDGGFTPSEHSLAQTEEVRIGGFIYNRLGSPYAEAWLPSSEEVERLILWLGMNRPYTPQPYEQMAKVLRAMGHVEEAHDISYAGREAARHLAWNDHQYFVWIGQTLLMSTIGYGYGVRHFRSLFWIIGLISFGILALLVFSQEARVMQVHEREEFDRRRISHWVSLAMYSLDMLIPVIELDRRHGNIDLQNYARYYFYCHKILGFIIGTFLVAGLAGLTQ